MYWSKYLSFSERLTSRTENDWLQTEAHKVRVESVSCVIFVPTKPVGMQKYFDQFDLRSCFAFLARIHELHGEKDK